jgi:hypothetical protein
VSRNGSKSGEQFLGTWEPRIGNEAALTLQRQRQAKRTFQRCVLIWVAFEIAFQLARITLGIQLSMLWLVVAIGYSVQSIRLASLATEQAGRHLKIAKLDRKFIPLAWVSTFDRWLAFRGAPGWPRKAARRY